MFMEVFCFIKAPVNAIQAAVARIPAILRQPYRKHGQFRRDVNRTCAVADAFVLDDVLVLKRFQDLDFSLKVSDVLCCSVLQFLHGHDLAGVVLKRIVSAHLHAAKVSLWERADVTFKTSFGGLSGKINNINNWSIFMQTGWVNASLPVFVPCPAAVGIWGVSPRTEPAPDYQTLPLTSPRPLSCLARCRCPQSARSLGKNKHKFRHFNR